MNYSYQELCLTTLSRLRETLNGMGDAASVGPNVIYTRYTFCSHDSVSHDTYTSDGAILYQSLKMPSID